MTAALPTYSQVGIAATVLFVMARLLQGMAFGAMVPLGWIMVAEQACQRSVAVYCSLVAASLVFGSLIALMFFRALDQNLTYLAITTYGWRLPFIVGGLFSLTALALCKYISETAPFVKYASSLEAAAKKPKPTYLSLIPQFNRPYNLVLISVLCFIIASLFMVMVLLLPKLITLKFDIDPSLLTFAHILGLLFMVFGCLFFGTIGEKLGIAKALSMGAMALILQTIFFYSHLVAGNGDYILIFYAVLGFCSGIIGLCATLMVQVFPVSIRSMGVSVIYNIIFAVAGGIVSFALFYITSQVAIAPALYLTIIGIITLTVSFYIDKNPIDKRVDQILTPTKK